MSNNFDNIDYLNGLRGVAVVLVILSHYSEYGVDIVLIDFSWFGKVGVYLFFVLSSFLLTRQFLVNDRSQSFSVVALTSYFSRRFFRVFPLYLLVCFVSWLVTVVLGSYTGGKGVPFTMSTDDLFLHLTLQAGREVLWSIPVEIKFYFFLPIFAWLYSRGFSWKFDFVVVILTVVGFGYFFPQNDMQGNSIFLVYYIPIFVLGGYAAALCCRATGAIENKTLRALPWIALFFIISTLAPVVHLFFPQVDPHVISRWGIFYGILWAVIISSLYVCDNRLKFFLNSQVLAFLGKISFSLYLLHYPVVKIVSKIALGNIFAAWVAVVGTVFLAWICYFFIEKPFLNFRIDKFFTRRNFI